MAVRVNGKLSSWAAVLSGVPQGSVLGPLLFLLFVNELPTWIINSIKMFADDTKIWCRISTREDSLGLQEDQNKLISWSQTWLLRFHSEKCKVMHIGHQINTEYKMEDSGKTVQLMTIKEEKDLGIYIVDNLKPSLQCTKSSDKAMSVMRLIKRNFKSIDIEELLYKAYIRPHLEYCIQVWSPYLRKDIECLERVQRRATKLVGSLKKKPYAERLKALQLTTLEKRQLRGDLIKTYKIVTNKENIDSAQFFEFTDTGHDLRGHSLKLSQLRNRSRVRRTFFSQRVVADWNRLPQYVVDAPSTNAFKTVSYTHLTLPTNREV